MNIEDKKLLDIYVLGWNDSSKNKPRFNQFSGIEHKAYQLGWCDFIIGDEVSSVDYQSDDKILSNIKNN